jgi:hypothetical protein
MADNVVPSMSDRGWIRSAPEKADALMSDFYSADMKQTYLYPEGIANLQGLIQKYGKDINSLTVRLQTVMETYFRQYFTMATINITSDADEIEDSKVTLKVSCFLVQGKEERTLEDLLEISSGQFKRIIHYNQTGAFS